MAADVAAGLRAVRATLPEGVKLVAVSKFHPAEEIMAAYAEGQRAFGESHVQELDRKRGELPEDIEWHFIGHLQTNKVKYIAPYISMVDAVDSVKLLKEIDRQAAKWGRVVDVLLELHIAEEATKYGFTPDGCREMLAAGEWRGLEHVRICGDEVQIRREFNEAAALFDELKQRYFASDDSFRERSWGMSGDYQIAVQCRSTMVRVGTAIFGEREY